MSKGGKGGNGDKGSKDDNIPNSTDVSMGVPPPPPPPPPTDSAPGDWKKKPSNQNNANNENEEKKQKPIQPSRPNTGLDLGGINQGAMKGLKKVDIEALEEERKRKLAEKLEKEKQERMNVFAGGEGQKRDASSSSELFKLVEATSTESDDPVFKILADIIEFNNTETKAKPTSSKAKVGSETAITNKLKITYLKDLSAKNVGNEDKVSVLNAFKNALNVTSLSANDVINVGDNFVYSDFVGRFMNNVPEKIKNSKTVIKTEAKSTKVEESHVYITEPKNIKVTGWDFLQTTQKFANETPGSYEGAKVIKALDVLGENWIDNVTTEKRNLISSSTEDANVKVKNYDAGEIKIQCVNAAAAEAIGKALKSAGVKANQYSQFGKKITLNYGKMDGDFSDEKLKSLNKLLTDLAKGPVPVPPVENAPEIRPSPKLSNTGSMGAIQAANQPKLLKDDGLRLYKALEELGLNPVERIKGDASKGNVEIEIKFNNKDEFTKCQKALNDIGLVLEDEDSYEDGQYTIENKADFETNKKVDYINILVLRLEKGAVTDQVAKRFKEVYAPARKQGPGVSAQKAAIISSSPKQSPKSSSMLLRKDSKILNEVAPVANPDAKKKLKNVLTKIAAANRFADMARSQQDKSLVSSGSFVMPPPPKSEEEMDEIAEKSGVKIVGKRKPPELPTKPKNIVKISGASNEKKQAPPLPKKPVFDNKKNFESMLNELQDSPEKSDRFVKGFYQYDALTDQNKAYIDALKDYYDDLKSEIKACEKLGSFKLGFKIGAQELQEATKAHSWT